MKPVTIQVLILTLFVTLLGGQVLQNTDKSGRLLDRYGAKFDSTSEAFVNLGPLPKPR